MTERFPSYSSSKTWKVTSSVGGRFPDINPIFTPDKNYILILTCLELRVYSRSTNQIIRSIPIDLVYEIRDIQLDETDNSLVRIIRSGGQYEVINWLDKSIDKVTVDLEHDFNKIVAKLSDASYLVYNNKHGLLSLTKSDSWERSTLIAGKVTNLFTTSNSKQYFCIYSESKSGDEIVLTVGKFDKSDYSIVNQKAIKRYRPATSIAISDDGLLAVGSITGVIDLYYDVFTEQGPSIRALKWHNDSVLSLSFSLDDNYLLSGGKERVLVFWQLETDNTQFLPRLDGDITNIYVDPASELYGLSLQGNQLVVISAIDLVSRFQVSGVKAIFNDKLPIDYKKETKKHKHKDYAKVHVSDCTTSYYINPATKHGYFPTKDGSQLQVYDLNRDQQIRVFSTASTIQVGKIRSESLIEDPAISHVAFTSDGKYMATVDECVNTSIDKLLSKDDKQINLKFWTRSEKATNNDVKWELATRVSSPHGLNKSIVDIIATGGNSPGFITASQDGGIRLWKPTNEQEIAISALKRVSWGIRKFLPPSGINSSAISITASTDSSVLILGYETTLKLIDGKKFQLIRTLPNILGSRVRHLQIVGSKLVALSKTRLVVWDLLTNKQVWSIKVHSLTHGKRLLAVDVANGRIALAANFYTEAFKVISAVWIFRVESPVPIYIDAYPSGISALNHIPGTENFSIVNIHGCISQLTYGTKETLEGREGITIGSGEITGDNKLRILYEAQKSNDDEDNYDLNMSVHDQVLNIHSFDRVFDEINIASLESIMDRVLSITSPKVR